MRCKGTFVTGGGVERPFGYIAKQFRKRKWARTLYQNLVALDRYLAKAATVRVPRPVVLDEEIGLVVMEELPGKDLKRALPDVDLSSRWAAGDIAAFHPVPPCAGASRCGRAREVRHAAKRMKIFRPPFPDWPPACRDASRLSGPMMCRRCCYTAHTGPSTSGCMTASWR
jgi:hypothetical protein